MSPPSLSVHGRGHPISGRSRESPSARSSLPWLLRTFEALLLPKGAGAGQLDIKWIYSSPRLGSHQRVAFVFQRFPGARSRRDAGRRHRAGPPHPRPGSLRHHRSSRGESCGHLGAPGSSDSLHPARCARRNGDSGFRGHRRSQIASQGGGSPCPSRTPRAGALLLDRFLCTLDFHLQTPS